MWRFDSACTYPLLDGAKKSAYFSLHYVLFSAKGRSPYLSCGGAYIYMSINVTGGSIIYTKGIAIIFLYGSS